MGNSLEAMMGVDLRNIEPDLFPYQCIRGFLGVFSIAFLCRHLLSMVISR